MGKAYSKEFKERVIAECYRVGNIALVARRFEISENTVYSWMRNQKKNGGSNSASEKDLEKKLKKVNSENDELKKIIGEKDLKIAVLEDLLDKANPQ